MNVYALRYTPVPRFYIRNFWWNLACSLYRCNNSGGFGLIYNFILGKHFVCDRLLQTTVHFRITGCQLHTKCCTIIVRTTMLLTLLSAVDDSTRYYIVTRRNSVSIKYLIRQSSRVVPCSDQRGYGWCRRRSGSRSCSCSCSRSRSCS